MLSKYRCRIEETSAPAIATALTNAFGLAPGGGGEGALAYNALNTYGLGLSGGRNGASSQPKAFVTIVVFDANYNLVESNTGWEQLNSTAQQTGSTKTPHQYLMKEMTITQPGYAYVFLSNENPTLVDVYFDDFKITHTQSPIVAGSDYYPFGLVMDGRQISDEAYRYGYQGQYAEKNDSTGWNEFQLRMYDARFGRWLSPDPYGQFASPYLAMGNAPHMGTDPDGGWCCGGGGAVIEGVNQVTVNGVLQGAETMTTFFLEEVVTVTATRILPSAPSISGLIGPVLRRFATSTTSFLGAAANAVNNNVTVGLMPLKDPESFADPNAARNGQFAGNVISLAWGGLEIAGGIIGTAAGGTVSLTGFGATIGVPVIALSLPVVAHGGAVFGHAVGNLNRVHNVNMSGSGRSAGRIYAETLKDFKALVNKLSQPGSKLTQAELDELRKLASKFGGRVRVDLDGIRGTGVNPHAHVEGLGKSVESRHIWLENGVK